MEQRRDMKQAGGAPTKDENLKRDTKRVLQVLLPGLTGPSLDLCANTIFASTTLESCRRRTQSGNGAAGGRFRIRRMDSGAFGEFDIEYPIGKRPNLRFTKADNLNFEYQPPAAAALAPGAKQHGRK